MKTLIVYLFCLLLLNAVCHSQWQQTAGTPEGGGITDMVVLTDGTIITTVSSFNWPSGQQGGIRRSSNGGASWQNVINAYIGRTLRLGSSGKIFASYWLYPQNEGMFYSTNGGLNWSQSYFGNSNDNVFSITSKDNDNTVFIGTRFGVWRSINNGLWQFVSTGIPANTFVYDLDIDETGTYIAAGTSKGLYISSNNGAGWVASSGISLTDTIYTVGFTGAQTDALGGNFLFSGTSSGEVYKNDGIALYIAAVLVVAFFGKLGDIEVVTDDDIDYICCAISPSNADNLIGPGYSFSTNYGQSWIEMSNGLPSNPKMSSITYRVSGGNINYYAGLFENSLNGAKVYKMSVPIGIQQISNEIPNNYLFSQNYPNPFNPMTKIKFSIPKSSNVNVTVFDVLGRHIATLVNEKLKAGTYETQWNAINIPGGAYFYRIEADDFTETKKIILVK